MKLEEAIRILKFEKSLCDEDIEGKENTIKLSKAIETVLQELENYKEGKIVSLKLLENFYLVSKDREKQMTLGNKKLFDNYIPKEVIEKKIEELKENGYWNFINERDLQKTIDILQKLLK